MDIMTAVVPKDITNSVPTDDRKIMSNSEAKALKNTCSVLLSPLYAPVAKSMSINNPIQHLESDNLIWEPRATKFFDFGDYFSYAANKLLIETVDHPAENFVSQQRDSTSTLRSRSSFPNFHALKKRTSMGSFISNSSDLPSSPLGDNNNNVTTSQQQFQQTKVRRSSNPTVISDVASEHSEKSTIELEKEQKKATLYKTEMCRNWEERGSCRYGNKCQFAHSDTELRKVTHHPKYKTEICKTFWQNGTCPYGKRCCFIHNDKNRLLLCKRRNSADNLKNSSKNNKSKGLSKVGSDPALYGSYVNDSASSGTIEPVTSNLKGTPTSSSTESLRAFTDAYFSGPLVLPGSISNDPILNGEISTVHDESHPGSSSINVNTTPTNSRDDEDDEINVPLGYADKPLLLRELLTDDGTSTLYDFNSIQPDLYDSKLDQNDHVQARRRASTTSCRLEKANVVNNTSNVVGNTILRERSVSMSVKQPTNLVSVVGQNRGRRLAIFRNLG
ncbi:20860_t:CDS:2 [Racocetra persica]|uniref:20860_t:CDS:1 n=1 Tax=Racocetra persica TaxID=160502 RepID=A0ACA9LTF6_9GLOM|nr:20860_t:CDS:2 [Racocetra persica]